MAIIDKKGKTTSRITFNVFKMEMRPSLIEFLEQDWKVNVSLAIDFTLSNLEIQDQRSLSTFNTHMRRPSSMFATWCASMTRMMAESKSTALAVSLTTSGTKMRWVDFGTSMERMILATEVPWRYLRPTKRVFNIRLLQDPAGYFGNHVLHGHERKWKRKNLPATNARNKSIHRLLKHQFIIRALIFKWFEPVWNILWIIKF